MINRRHRAAVSVVTLVALLGSGCTGTGPAPTTEASLLEAATPAAPTGDATLDVVSPSPTTSGVQSSSPNQPASSPLSTPSITALNPMESFATDFPQGIAIAFDSVWTTNEFLDTVTRIDPATGDVTTIRTPAGSGPQDLEIVGGSMFAAGGGGLFEIDPATNQATRRADGVVGSVAYVEGSLWLSIAGGHVLRLDRETYATLADMELAQLPPREACGSVVSGAGSIWIGCGSDVDRIDPATNAVISTIPDAGDQPVVTAVGDDIWVKTSPNVFSLESPEDGSANLVRLDPETNQLLPNTSFELVRGASATSPLVDGETIWYPTSFGAEPAAGTLYEFDPSEGVVVKAYDLSEGKNYGTNFIGFGFGSMWGASGPANQVRRFAMPLH